MKDYRQIRMSVLSNWDTTRCLVSTDVSSFDKNDFYFFLSSIIDLCGKSVKAEHLQYYHNISLLIADLIIRS